MKIKDLLEKIIKKDDIQSWSDVHEIASREFDIHDVYNDHTCKLKKYPFGTWYCTSDIVGNFAYYLDNEPVAISYKQYRKSNEEIKWLSKEAYMKTRKYLLSLRFEQEDIFKNVKFLSLEDDIKTSYKLEYNSNLLDHHMKSATLNGEAIEIIEKHKGFGFEDNDKTKNYLPCMVKIREKSGKESWINIKELDFYFLLEKNT